MASPAPRSAARSIRRSRPRSAKPRRIGRARLCHATLHRLWQLLLKGHRRGRRRGDAARGGRNGAAARRPCQQPARSRQLARKLASGEAIAPAAAPRRAAPPRRRPAAAAGPAGRFPGAGRAARGEGRARARRSSSIDYSAWSAMRRPSSCSKPLKPAPAISSASLAAALKALTGVAWTVELQELGAAEPIAARAGRGGRARPSARGCWPSRRCRRRSKPFPTPSS